ncbi:MAG: DUF1653 domain-containing protein [Candidatus Saccharimonadales bacterium]
MAHKSQTELASKVADLKVKIPIGSQWQHYKSSGNYYEVTDIVIIEADDSLGVVYRAKYGKNLTFIRPAKSWLQTVDWQNRTLPRFKRVNKVKND